MIDDSDLAIEAAIADLESDLDDVIESIDAQIHDLRRLRRQAALEKEKLAQTRYVHDEQPASASPEG